MPDAASVEAALRRERGEAPQDLSFAAYIAGAALRPIDARPLLSVRGQGIIDSKMALALTEKFLVLFRV
jgi:hypothetical protein